MTPPQHAPSVASPGEFGAVDPLRIGHITSLWWEASAQPGFDFHWIHELSGGAVEAEYRAIRSSGAAWNVSVQVRGEFPAEVSFDEDGRLRLTIHQGKTPEATTAVVVNTNRGASPAESVVGEGLVDALAGVTGLPELLERGFGSLEAFRELSARVRQSARDVHGAIRSDQDLRRLGQRLRDAAALEDRILECAGEALRAKIDVRLGRSLRTTDSGDSLFDCSFPHTDTGLALFRECRQGNLTGVLNGARSHVRLRNCAFSSAVHKSEVIELHLPFLEQKWWNKRLSLYGRMRAEVSGNGRVHVYTAAARNSVEAHNFHQSVLMLTGALAGGSFSTEKRFALIYQDSRSLTSSHALAALPAMLCRYDFPEEAIERVARLTASAPRIEAEFSLSIPGSLVPAWLEAPGERSVAFYGAMVRVASAVQSSLRLWLPYAYFSEADRYDDPETAWPLVAYQASKPFSRRVRSEFTYDPMNPRSVSLALGHAGRRMPEVLASIERRLLSAGKLQTAALYRPAQAKKIIASLRRGPRRFKNLLAADAHLVGNLVSLANRGRRLRGDLESEADTATKKVSHFVESFVRSFHVRLRRLYDGQDFAGFGSLLFVEATRALATAFGREAPIEAVLKIRIPGLDGEHVFVNDGCPAGDQRCHNRTSTSHANP